MANTEKSRSLFEFDSAPPLRKALPISLQHIMAMFLGTVTVPIIICGAAGTTPQEMTMMIQYSLIMAGIATLIQLFPIWRVGSKLPIIFSAGFTFVPTLSAIGSKFGLAGIFGAQLVGGLVTIILGLCLKRISKYFPPIVTGTIILSIGLSLYPIALNYMAGGVGSPTYGSLKNWMIAGVTLVTVIIFNLFVKGFLNLASILIGVAVGYTLSAALGLISLAPVAEASWLALPIPFQFGMRFEIAAIVPMILITVVNVMQAVGDLSGTTVGGMDREPTGDELSGGVMAVGVTTIIGAIFGGPAPSSYSQNVGIVSMTKVVSRRVLSIAAILMLALGFLPKFSAILSTMPSSIIGGGTIIVFGMIAMTGIKLITKEPLTARNTAIVGLSVALGMGMSVIPEAALQYFPASITPLITEPVVVAGLTAFLLNLLAPDKTADEEEAERKALDA